MSSSISNLQQKWGKVLTSLDQETKEEDEQELKTKKSLSYHSLLNSVQLMKRVADEKLMEGEKSQQLSMYFEAIQLYKDILQKIQHYNHHHHQQQFTDATSTTTTTTTTNTTPQDKLPQILFSCHLNIACGALRCQFYPEAIHHCDCAIGILTVYHHHAEEYVLSLLRAKYFKCFALLQLSESNEEHIELAESEMQSMKSLLATSFLPEQLQVVGKDYLELFSRIESKVQKYSLKGEQLKESGESIAVIAEDSSSSAVLSEPQFQKIDSLSFSPSPSPVKIKKFFPALDEFTNPAVVSSTNGSPARRSLQMKQFLIEVEEAERQKQYSKAIRLLEDWNKLSTNPLASAKSLFYQGEFTYKLSKNIQQAERYYLESTTILQDILHESDESVQIMIQYQLSLNFSTVAKLTINESSATPTNQVDYLIASHMTNAIDILEKLSLLLYVFSQYDEDEEVELPASPTNASSSSSALGQISKESIYHQLQLPPKFSLSQEIHTTEVLLSQIILQLLSDYETFSDFLRSRRYFYDCFLIVQRNIQFIYYVQQLIDTIEQKFHAPAAKKNKLLGGHVGGGGGKGIASGMAGSPNHKRKNTSSFHVYSTNDLTALMVLLQKRQSIAFFRLGLLLRNVQVLNRLNLTTVAESSSLRAFPLEQFNFEQSFFYRNKIETFYETSLHTPSNSSDDSFDYPLRKKFQILPPSRHRDRVLFIQSQSDQHKESYFNLTNLSNYRESMLNCLEKAGNDCFYLLEFVMSFQSLKLCGEVLLEKYNIPSYTQLVNLLDHYYNSSTQRATVTNEDAERVHDVWKLVKKSAEKIYSHPSTVIQDKLQYLIEGVMALHQAGIVILFASTAASTSSSINHLAQRSFESAQSLQKEVQAVFDQQQELTLSLQQSSSSLSSLQEDVSILFADINYCLGFVYLRSGKLQYAKQELNEAIELYRKFYSSSLNAANTDMIRKKLKNAFAILAFLEEATNQKDSAKAVYEAIRALSIGPLEDGTDEVARLKAFIEKKLPSQSLPVSVSSSSSSSILGSRSVTSSKEKEEAKRNPPSQQKKSSSVLDVNLLIAYSIIFALFVAFLSFLIPFLKERNYLFASS